MSTSIHQRVASLPEFSSVESPSAMGLACATAVLVWGPLDMVLTAYAWHLEMNPVTIMLGLGGWLAMKTLVVVLVAVVYWQTRGWQDKRPLVAGWVMALATVGALLVGLNLTVVIGGLF